MKLHKSSWHFKLHKLLYGKYARDPVNFCPYFWKTIVLGVIFIVPCAIICAPARLLDQLILDEEDRPDFDQQGYFSEYLIYGLFVTGGLYIVYSMFAMWFVYWGKEPAGVHYAGIIGWLLTVCIGIAYFVDKRKKARRKRLYSGVYEKKPNVFVEGVKSWYKKNCPLIQWESESELKPENLDNG
jgi:hypothetical protein